MELASAKLVKENANKKVNNFFIQLISIKINVIITSVARSFSLIWFVFN